MVKERRSSMAEKPEPTPERSGRNPRGYGGGASSATARRGNSRPGEEDLMGAVVESENMRAAYRRVVGNKGSAGVDGMSVAELKPYLVCNWRRIREELLEGRYRPQPVLRVEIPKAGVGCESLASPRSPTASPRRWQSGTWSRRWSRDFIGTHTGIGLGSRRLRPLG